MIIRDEDSLKRIKLGGNKRLRGYLSRRKLQHPRYSSKFYNSEVVKAYVDRVGDIYRLVLGIRKQKYLMVLEI